MNVQFVGITPGLKQEAREMIAPYVGGCMEVREFAHNLRMGAFFNGLIVSVKEQQYVTRLRALQPYQGEIIKNVALLD